MSLFLLGCANTEKPYQGESWFNDYNQLVTESDTLFHFDTSLSEVKYDINEGLLGIHFGDHIDTVVNKFGKPQSIEGNRSYEVDGITLNYGRGSYFKINVAGEVIGIKIFNLDFKKLMLTNGLSFESTQEEVQAVFSDHKVKQKSGSIITYIDDAFTYNLYFYHGHLSAITITRF
jgi:hypothetical protein